MNGPEQITEVPSIVSREVVSPPEVGLGSGVTRGGLWSLGGQVAVLLASLIATPFVVRLLAPELYGLLTLIQALIGYLAFAGLGTSLASTKFGADAFAHDDSEGEVAVVWTSLAIVSGPALLTGLLAAAAAHPLMQALSVPSQLQNDGALALRIAVGGFVARSIYGCLNTPQAVRLRWDLITKIEALTSVMQVALVPIVLALGGGLVAAVFISTTVEILRVLLHIIASRRLQPQLLHVRIRRELVAPLIRFGGALAVSSMVMIPLRSIDRLFVARYTSVSSVAFYSLAVTVATMLSVFPMAICQPLLPAFARLRSTTDPMNLQSLFIRATRGIFLFTVPATVILLVIARPAFTIWAGTEYGRQSTGPFYILVLGLAANAVAYPAVNVLLAANRANLMARYYLIELLPYIAVAGLLTSWYGMMGAAVAYSVRMFGDWIFFSMAAKQVATLSVSPLPDNRRSYCFGLAVLVIPPAITSIWLPSPLASVVVTVGSVVGYGVIVFTRVLTNEEVTRIRAVVSSVRQRWSLGQ